MPYDIPTAWGLVHDYKKAYEHDQMPIDPAYVEQLVASGLVVALLVDEVPVGFMSFDDVVEGLRAEIHFLVKPGFYLQILRSGVLSDVLSYVFDSTNLIKLKGVVMARQDGKLHQAERVLKWHGFRKVARLEDEVTKAGTPRAITIYELNSGYWFRTGRSRAAYEFRKQEKQQGRERRKRSI